VGLAARRAEALDAVAEECRRAGGEALAVPTDVTDPAAVEALAQHAVDRFGRIDVWVNNAGVTLFTAFEEAPPDVHRRVIETNLLGYLYGAQAAVRRFREQGRGTLILVSSAGERIGGPVVATYVTSKWGIRGLAESLRMELAGTGIEVCRVLPASIDTPLFQHGANYTGRLPRPLRPVYPAEMVAEAIVHCAERPKREVIAGRAGRLVSLQWVVPRPLLERIASRAVWRTHFFEDQPVAPASGNLFEPSAKWTSVSGGWRDDGEDRRGPRRPVLGAALAVVPALVALVGLALMKAKR
jgi:NAD(P)-dependent dehydrogenase (short-subunit alcohol dehydrogenase family)